MYEFGDGENVMIRTATLTAATKKQLDKLLEQVLAGKLELEEALERGRKLRDADWRRKQVAM
jgi:hypothetical protein